MVVITFKLIMGILLIITGVLMRLYLHLDSKLLQELCHAFLICSGFSLIVTTLVKIKKKNER